MKRWMQFVDGEGLTIRGQALAIERGFVLPVGPFHQPDTFVWFPHRDGVDLIDPVRQAYPRGLEHRAERSFYYTAAQGDSNSLLSVRQALWNLNFQPEVFHKAKGKKAKGVDIALTKDILSNAFLDNYDVAVLLAGDGDYVPVIQEVKRLGKSVVLSWFDGESSGVSEELRLTSDMFADLTLFFASCWAPQGAN